MNQSNKLFFKGWPYNGKYIDTLNKVYNLVVNYLYNFPKYKNFTVIFDIDDTLVFTDPANSLSYNVKKNINGYMIFPANIQIVNLAKLCKKLGFYVIIITARPYETEESSIYNLKLLGVEYDKLIHNHEYPNPSFKINLKKKISQNHNIILSIGDAWHDILNLINCLCIKLPDLTDNNAYFTYNNKNYYKIK